MWKVAQKNRRAKRGLGAKEKGPQSALADFSFRRIAIAVSRLGTCSQAKGVVAFSIHYFSFAPIETCCVLAAEKFLCKVLLLR